VCRTPGEDLFFDARDHAMPKDQYEHDPGHHLRHVELLDRPAQQVAAFESAVEPENRRITAQIEKLLAAR
jgi:hypothetical protein